ncbi:MAG TPA: FeoB small GTPase domain-containing protein, partial [Opitutales bacterium]|nr:FeoB small GTPase domain-containing protein [Opitutales bacterium]
GRREHKGALMTIVDLPGTYSLTAYSEEELLARNYIIGEKPDVVVDIVDSSNLERNLYLAVQLMELGVPLVLAFNMSDMAKARGFSFDIGKLARFFDAKIVETVGSKGQGMNELLDAVLEVAQSPEKRAAGRSPLAYGREIEEEIARVCAALSSSGEMAGRYDARWLAVKLLEGDRDLAAMVQSAEVIRAVRNGVERIRR